MIILYIKSKSFSDGRLRLPPGCNGRDVKMKRVKSTNIISAIIAIMPMLTLPYCDSCRQTENTADTLTALAPVEKSAVDTMIAFDLNRLKEVYKKEYGERKEDNECMAISNFNFQSIPIFDVPSIPICEQCSDLEQLLILERILTTAPLLDLKPPYAKYYGDFYIYYDLLPKTMNGASYLAKNDEAVMKRTLRNAELAYEKKFNVPTPWHWVCSVEERIKRLNAAVKTGKRYPNYPVTEDRNYYNMGKTMAAYEMWFKRPFPECAITTFSEQERLTLAEQALDVVLPYRSKKEEDALKNKLKTGYKETFKIPIPDYWLSVERICYDYGSMFENYRISVTRTGSGGAIARMVRHGIYATYYYSLKLDTADWLNFINALDKLGVSDWKIKTKPPRQYIGDGNSGTMTLKIFTLNNDGKCIGNIKIREIDGYYHVLPPNFEEFMALIKTMRDRIEK